MPDKTGNVWSNYLLKRKNSNILQLTKFCHEPRLKILL
jgi:hypothetical protein